MTPTFNQSHSPIAQNKLSKLIQQYGMHKVHYASRIQLNSIKAILNGYLWISSEWVEKLEEKLCE